MPQRPVPADPGPEDSEPAARPEPDPDWEWFAAHPDPRSEQDQEAWLDHLAELDEPFDPEEWWDPEGPPPGEDALTPEELAEIGQAAAGEVRAADAAMAGRRGPGQRGSARVFPVSRPARRRRSVPGWRWTFSRGAPGWRWRPMRPPGTETGLRGWPIMS